MSPIHPDPTEHGAVGGTGALLGRGQVMHARLVPRLHAFRYPSWFLMLPMRRLRTHPTLPGVAINRRGIVSFHDLDHGDGQGDALGWVERLLHSQGVHADGEIWLQTFPRLWGWVFKPVSFWYAHGADGHLRAVVAEVNNTFGERHAYVLHADDPTDHLPWGAPLQARKVLHVSPFCQPSGRYRFRFMRTARTAEPGERLLARVDHDDESGQPLLRTSWSGNLQPLTHRALWWACAAMPLQSLSVVARIHWHALRLWLKHVPLYTHPRHV